MLIDMKIVDIADQIYRDLSSPTDLSIPAIAFWVRSHIGELNNHIHASFSVNDTSFEIEQDKSGTKVEITEDEAAIFKKMYMVHYYDVKVRYNIGAAATDTVIEVSDGGSKVKKINKNEVIKSLTTLKKQEYEELQKLINAYKISNSTPRQVTGDDTVEGHPASDGNYERLN
tara:strand:- start:82615 stop:83130 length:516 start_codon:yes stop_codon:yes gene_type:complete